MQERTLWWTEIEVCFLDLKFQMFPLWISNVSWSEKLFTEVTKLNFIFKIKFQLSSTDWYLKSLQRFPPNSTNWKFIPCWKFLFPINVLKINASAKRADLTKHWDRCKTSYIYIKVQYKYNTYYNDNIQHYTLYMVA